jgi:hypothetical protein
MAGTAAAALLEISKYPLKVALFSLAVDVNAE